MFCAKCGSELTSDAVFCGKCGTPVNVVPAAAKPPKSRLAYALLGWFLGGFGIHNFYAGRIGCGIAQLILTITCFGAIVTEIWVAVELLTVKADAAGVEMTEQSAGFVVGLIAVALKFIGGLTVLCLLLFGGLAASAAAMQ